MSEKAKKLDGNLAETHKTSTRGKIILIVNYLGPTALLSDHQCG